MSKLSDAIISMVLRKGLIGEARNLETEVVIPNEDSPIKVTIKCENVTVRVEKEEK